MFKMVAVTDLKKLNNKADTFDNDATLVQVVFEECSKID